MGDTSIDGLIKVAQNTFVDDLKNKAMEMHRLLSSCKGGCSKEDANRIIRFFHSVNGTAFTLGLGSLGAIGRSWEAKIKTVMEKGDELDEPLIKEIHEAIDDIKSQISLMGKKGIIEQDVDYSDEYVNITDRGKVLLVDDDVTILKLLEDALTAEGYTVYICDDPESVPDLIALTRPDVVILDVIMPRVDGYELLEQIKTNDEYCDMYVFFLSAAKDTEDRIKGMRAGADDYITKPFIIEEVIARVETVLRRGNRCREMLIRDSLTDVYSRYYFNQRIIEEIERYKRGKSVFSIAFLDLDHYKLVNDKYGHQVGDTVLKEFASLLSKNLRKCDSVYRYGGEEFIILLPDTSEAKAHVAVDRLREKISEERIKTGEDEVNIAFSAGISQINGPEDTALKLVNRADRAMYHAKRLGRDKVVIYEKGIEEKELKQRLLLVDDENTVLKLLKDRLVQTGYIITTAKDGNSAIKMAKEQHPDAIILDLILPDIDGYEVCRRIKDNVSTAAIKVIILSKRKDKEDIAKGLYSGADDYVTKPFSMVELEARIKKALNN